MIRAAAAAALAGALAGGCFRPPSASVLFSCDTQTAPQCPPGYTCAQDGCCHKDGTDPAENAGACRVLDPTATGAGTAGTATGSGAGGTASGGGTGTSSAGATSSTGATGSGSDTGTSTGTAGSSP